MNFSVSARGLCILQDSERQIRFIQIFDNFEVKYLPLAES